MCHLPSPSERQLASESWVTACGISGGAKLVRCDVTRHVLSVLPVRCCCPNPSVGSAQVPIPLRNDATSPPALPDLTDVAARSGLPFICY